MTSLREQDPRLADVITNEINRQRNNINLIASENYASEAVLEAQGSVLTNKYAEGYPGKRYYGGCEFVDVGERLAIERAKELFEAEHANVQPHSGAQANMAAYFAMIQPGDTVMGMSLDHGGHLTHGSPVNFSSKLYNFVPYEVDRELEIIDYDALARTAEEHRPKLIVSGATAYTRVIDFHKLREIADQVGAQLMADMAHIAGLVATDEHPTPVGEAHIVSTTTHKTLRGPRGGMILCDQDLARNVDRAVFPNAQGGPLQHIIAAKAVAFGEALRPEFADYQRQIKANARALADTLADGGLRLVAGGTDNHMVLVDLTPADITGRRAEEALGRANIVVNRNAIPYDSRPPRVASGVRLGTPAITSRGLMEEDSRGVGRLILRVLNGMGDESVENQVRDEVVEMSRRFPVPGIDR
ncbi:MAG: serine hydroxymethyltransferase [SAR202 cluster bacterium]|jgi:glycine hydroxymethyltransferase|nr:serine hydroxymethyltransferase [SAR202 cluster bacterium]MDP6302221.1 serine hydroxymethyltransferase [SAR202 cluster bacterium]MDP7104005.1 serine hydroxymethyltransferase [SAR202 cluster bacterium]MDP7225562.1 serine hydroxymethyltransferase [SAR202 cluster bacterium]HJO83180.1 serine hydroxymethyltransferase [SAR202 cluster bacterium]|tara:strand:- start:1613 stop:2857 length:1245 start_codon:yes stop_codon:yes gene_type:complete